MKRDEIETASSGGESKMDKNRLERIWDEVQCLNRAAGPWGKVNRSEEAVETV